jgi:hypothetical protein
VGGVYADRQQTAAVTVAACQHTPCWGVDRYTVL